MTQFNKMNFLEGIQEYIDPMRRYWSNYTFNDFYISTQGATSRTETAYPCGVHLRLYYLCGSCCSIFSFLCSVWWIVICSFVLFL